MFASSIATVAEGGRTFDICLIGAGPAGITLATRLGKRGFSVLLLEAGADTYTVESQELYRGDVFGPEPYPLDLTRLRFFGGTSNHWGGWTRYLETYDFRDKIPGVQSAWPIQRSDLDPYARETQKILEVGTFAPDERLDDNLNYIHYEYSPPVNFGQKYRAALEKADNITVVLNAALVNVQERSGEVTGIEVRGPDQLNYTVKAKRFVLCTGGIENSRLLLWANAVNGNRIVKEPQALGRYWMEHPHFTLGQALLHTDKVPWTFDQKNTAYVSPSQKAIREQRILNCALRLNRTHYEGTKALIADLACVAPETASTLSHKLKFNLVCGVMLRANWEQAPLPFNRVTLGDKRDALGIPRVDLHWEYTEIERHTAQRCAVLFGEYLVRNDMGRVLLLPWLQGESGEFPTDDEIRGNHQMGGTRMSDDPRMGVVDAQCKIHGLANFYVCGSSVFPSAGQANPTYTIVQLACRLADHLGEGRSGAVNWNTGQETPPSPTGARAVNQ